MPTSALKNAVILPKTNANTIFPAATIPPVTQERFWVRQKQLTDSYAKRNLEGGKWLQKTGVPLNTPVLYVPFSP